ncbi:MAG: O-acetyl-ADP-ribose deacetylase [Oscillospiraceae bacterium]|nr:O-acetyl-ADP-ribose deacetylase [Oscillospiraceae bacterium]
MPFLLVRNDITKMKVDAIVNAAKNSLLGGGGVDGAIHRAAGPRLLEECATLGGCETGKAKITKGYNLPAKYVIHTVGPVWNGGAYHEKDLLVSCYRSSMTIAKEYSCESVAFPLISSGAYGYPKDQAIRVAIDTIKEFLSENEMMVYLVVFDKISVSASSKMRLDIQQYIDDRYVEEHGNFRRIRPLYSASYSIDMDEDGWAYSERSARTAAPKSDMPSRSLSEYLKRMDESFSEMLLRKIKEKGMTEVECYKKANIDRKLFNKIKNNKNYKPSKPTVIAFAISLRLSLPETEDMLRKAGLALSHSSKFDIIIEYFIRSKNYDVFDINEALYEFDQPLLGC